MKNSLIKVPLNGLEHGESKPYRNIKYDFKKITLMDLKGVEVIYIKLEHTKKIIEISMESIKDSLIDKIADSKRIHY